MRHRPLSVSVAALSVMLFTIFLRTTAGADRTGPGSSRPESRPDHSCRIVFVVRHAEKGTTPQDDPPLTEAGAARARELARTLGRCPIDRLFASDTRRARETLAPLADSLGLPVEVHEVDDPIGLAREILSGPGRCFCVAGHGDTVVPILEGLGLRQHPDFGAIAYDDLFMVAIPPAGTASVVRLKYGAMPS